jgi:hypothetical protein
MNNAKVLMLIYSILKWRLSCSVNGHGGVPPPPIMLSIKSYESLQYSHKTWILTQSTTTKHTRNQTHPMEQTY